jgi:peptide-methionine (S)-S-oxide reductase
VKARRLVVVLAALGLLGLAFAALPGVDPAVPPAGGAPRSVAVPPPDIDEPTSAGSETAVLAGGCFWGVQGVYQHVKGVSAAESGYAGGDRATASYDAVSGGSTGHAESVRITYDPSQVTFGRLLRIFFSVVHDPTQLNRQGPDVGSQYRSAIFAQNPTQQRVAKAYIAQLTQAAVFPGPIVTSVTPKAAFFPAEPYHQDFLTNNPANRYIAIHDIPKLQGLAQRFPALYRDQPVLMLAGGR